MNLRDTEAATRPRVEIIGHLLQVFPLGGGRWEVLVDGEEVSSSCTSTYAAWAVGAAESYRRGQKPGRPKGALGDRS